MATNGNGNGNTAATTEEDRRRDLELMRKYLSRRHKLEGLANSQEVRIQNPKATSFSTAIGPSHTHGGTKTTDGLGLTSMASMVPDHSIARQNECLLALVRAILLDLPLTLLFGLFLTVFCLREVHHQYFVPFLEAATRTDDHLVDEFTYYERSCTANDLTTDDLRDLIISNHSSTSAVETMMVHGGVVVPQILSPETVRNLRDFVVRRNAALDDAEQLPVSQGHRRLSFAMDATEDPSLPVALREVATHPLLQPLLEQLVGKDPAVAEITAITAYYGCSDQVWHSDVKADGSPLKFARTYTHSFSLFIPLQDTTAAMGATELCPGTHYCASAATETVCEQHGIQLSEASSDHIWHSGDGAILSQQVWHRGFKHNDPKAPERIVFIMSFLARPDLTNDRRQLSRGTYFHMKWNMWGHTWKDLFDADRSMASPFALLRCLGLWKPWNRNWGYDLITSAALRLANGQDGVSYDDLQVFVDSVIAKIGIPKFLQGPVRKRGDAWQRYLRETLDKCYHFLRNINAAALGMYFLAVVAITVDTRSKRMLMSTVYRLLLTHGVLLLMAYYIMQRVRTSRLATDIRAQRTLRRAFPDATETFDDGSITAGITTFPERYDVLVGTRFDGKFLGAFDRWLDYHPGNVAFRSAVSQNAEWYKSYAGISDAFLSRVIQSVRESSMANSRFLQQDYRTGLWRIMSESEAREHVGVALLAKQLPILEHLDTEIVHMLAGYRFGLERGSVLAKLSQAYLMHWRQHILFPKMNDKASKWPRRRSPNQVMRLHSTLQPYMSKPKLRGSKASRSPAWRSSLSREPVWDVGDSVKVYNRPDGLWYRSVILALRKDQTVDLVRDDGTLEERVPRSNIRQMRPLQEGLKVNANFGERGEWFPGTVVLVRPSLHVDVVYEDGDYESNVSPGFYAAIDH